MFNEMFEIANQAYILQQQTDTEEIDDRNWREWTKLFRTQESIKAAYVEGKPDFDEDDDKIIGDTQIDTEEEALQKAEFTLDDEELTDYLQNQGQWKTNLITDEENKVNIEDILNSGEPAGGKPGKGGQTESKLLEEETVIPEDLPKNNILGDVIEKVIYLNYEGEEEIVKPDVPDHLPLKLAIIGQAFSGKKTQAQIISEKYNLKQYHAFELIEEALGRAGEDQEPIDEEHVEKEANTIEGEKVEEVEEKPVEGENEGEGKQEIEGDKEGNVDTKVEGDVEDEQKEKSQTENQNVEPENEDKEKSQEEMPNEEQPEPNAEGENQENTEEAQDGEIKVEGEGEGNQENIEGTKEGPNEEVLDIEAEFERNGSHDDSHLMPKEEKFEKLRRNIFREIGKKMEQELLEGREIPEELVVDLLVSRIKADFAYKTQEQIDQDIKTIIEREEEIKEQLAKANELKGKSFRNTEPINEEILQKELEECSNFNKFGWILVDFPNSLQQASKLEAQLSGYLPEIDKEICLRNQKLTSACRIIEPSDKPNIRDTLINSGLDSVLWLETSREECRRRALGRRVDLANDTEYHIDDNPPSTTSPPLCERLMQVIEPERAEEVIPDKHLAFDKNTKRLRQWFEKFGYEEEEDETTKLELCQNVNGQSTGESDLINTNPNDIASNISFLDLIIQRKQSQWNAKREQFRNEIIAEKERIKQEEEERIRLEEEQKRKAEEEAKKAEEGEGEGEDKEEVHEDPPKEDEDQPKEEEEKEEEEVVEEPPSKDNIDDDFAPVLMTIWDEIEAKYLRKMRKNFNLYRNQRNRIVTGLNKTQKYFVQYLNRPDTKQALLDEFVIAFNKFSDEYPDLREDEQTKEELHQRADTLSDKLWEISEQRRDEAVEERQKIMENGWAEFELEQVVLIAQSMIQAEVDKFRNSAHLLQDYYYSIEDRLVPDPPEKIHYEIISKNEDGTIEELPPIFETVGETGEGEEAKEVYPRLDKLFERGLKAQTLPELESTPPGGAAGTDKKAGKAKDAKKGGAEEENEEKYFYEQELQDAISTEKAVLRYRLTLIRNWALNLMKEIRVKSSTCHDKLDIWIKIAFKAETDAIIEQERVIKRSIEEETKLQHELRIKGMDFYLDEKFLNFEDPPPEVFAAREEPQDSRFTIIQLESLVNELIVSSKDGLINNELLVDLLLSRTINSKAFSDKNGVPPALMN